MENQDRVKAALADRYEIEREIGSGGMAVVYLAADFLAADFPAADFLAADFLAADFLPGIGVDLEAGGRQGFSEVQAPVTP